MKVLKLFILTTLISTSLSAPWFCSGCRTAKYNDETRYVCSRKDGQTYPSRCFARCARALPITRGRCRGDCDCVDTVEDPEVCVFGRR